MKKTISRRELLKAVTIGAAGVALAACAPQATAQAPTSAPAVNSTSPTQSSSVPSAPVELIYWSFWNETESTALVVKDWITAYQSAHSNVKVTVVWNGRENQTKLRTALTSGTVVDFMDQDGDETMGGLVSEGQGLPVDDFLTQPAQGDTATVKDIFLTGVLDQYKSNGHYYLLPYEVNPVMFWYNKTLFDKAGVTAPKTWDDFLTTCKGLLAAGIAPLAVEGDSYYNFYLTYMMERLKGPGFIEKSIEDKTGAMWNDPAYTEMLTDIGDLWSKGYIPSVSKGFVWPAGQQTLALAQSSMELCGSWLPKELTDAGTLDPNFEWAGFPFPSIGTGAGKTTDLQPWPITYLILKNTQHSQEIFQFLQTALTKQNQQDMVTKSQIASARTGVDFPKALADGKTVFDNATAMFMDDDGGTALHPEFTNNVLNVNFLKAFLGDLTPDAFSAKMVSDAKTYWSTHTV